MSLLKRMEGEDPVISSNPNSCALSRKCSARSSLNAATVGACMEPMSRWRTGHFFDQCQSGSMARPWKRSRRPSKSERSVETASDLPKRRGRAMKNCAPHSPDAIE